MDFFPGRETTAREKKPPASPELLCRTKATVCRRLVIRGKLPAGLRSFARSSSPDWAKRKLALRPLRLCGEPNTQMHENKFTNIWAWRGQKSGDRFKRSDKSGKSGKGIQ